MSDQPYSMPDTIWFDMVPARGGEPYRIMVSKPTGEMPEAGWPVLYMSDGNACFPLAATGLGVQALYPKGSNVGQGIVVAIGYPGDRLYDSLRRSWDLCPPPGKTYPPFAPGGPDVVTGGGLYFLDFIDNEVKPRIGAMFKVDLARQSLYGHSFGGLFTLYALFSRPASFSRYIAVSPSIFWDQCLILPFEQAFSATAGAANGLFLHLSAGEYEGDDLAPFQIGREDAESRLTRKKETRTVAHAREMAERLSRLGPERIRTEFEVFARENHMSVLAPSISRALQIAFALQT